MMVWGEEYEKFGKTIAKGSVVEITAKVEQDSRTESLQLVAQAIRPLEAPAGGTAAKQNGSAAPAIRPLVLQLDSSRNTVDDLRSIHRIVREHPGTTPVHFSVRINGKRLHLTTKATIAAENGAMTALKEWIPGPR